MLLSAREADRIYEVTDSLNLHRNWVVVPLRTTDTPREILLPDAKLLIQAPGVPAFEGWLADLRSRLLKLDLRRVPPNFQHDPPMTRVSPHETPDMMSNRYLPDWRPRASRPPSALP